MATRLEHANICVRDIDAMIRFLQTAFPEFHVRGEGTSADGTRWVHVGTDEPTSHLVNRESNRKNGGHRTRARLA